MSVPPTPVNVPCQCFFFPKWMEKMYESMTSAFSLSLFSAGSGRQRNRFHSFTSLAKDKSYLAGIVVKHEVTLQWGVYQTFCLLRITFESSGGSSAPCPVCQRQCSRVVLNWLVGTTEHVYSIGEVCPTHLMVTSSSKGDFCLHIYLLLLVFVQEKCMTS